MESFSKSCKNRVERESKGKKLRKIFTIPKEGIVHSIPIVAGWTMVAVCAAADIFLIGRPDFLILKLPFIAFLLGASVIGRTK